MGGAAEELGFVPSTVSQQMSRLERLVETQLLVRTGGTPPLAPTAAGRQVDNAAMKLLGDIADFVEACRAASQGQVELRVASYASAAYELLPAVVAALKREHSSVDIRILQSEPEGGLLDLAAGSVDLVIAYRYMAGETPTPSNTYEAILGTERILRVQPIANLYDNQAWIAGIRGSPSRRLLEHWASLNGMKLDIRYETEDPTTVLAFCSAGLGQGLVPASVLAAGAAPDVTAEVLTVEGKQLSRKVLAITRHGYTHPLTYAFCRKLQESLSTALSETGYTYER